VPNETTNTVVIGGGQAGLAMSEHLGHCAVPHIVLERHRIAERWRSERWDSLVANGPCWHDRFPSKEFANLAPDAFASKEEVVAYFEEFAEQINSPIRCGVEVTDVRRSTDGPGFRVQTTDGVIEAVNVVAATGPFQHPLIPPVVPADSNVEQIHSSAYHNPQQLPDGAVLVVGAGSSGAQIADELLRSGKRVYLSVGPHDRPPRRYRDRDFVWWLGVLGKWEAPAADPATAHVTIAVSGAYGGHTLDFRRFAERGMTLLGMSLRFEDGVLHFARDLADNIEQGDANYLSLLDEADAFVARNELSLPEEPDARVIGPAPECVVNPVLVLDLEQAGITSIIWATGFANDFGWLNVDAFDEQGRPQHNRGVSSEPGIYFLGLPWLSQRGSSFIWGVWVDAKYLAGHVAARLAACLT
jgi:putative flavoprotein involved in K+ transport